MWGMMYMRVRPQSPDHRTEVDAPAFNGAYEDVRSAFFYYLQHWNQGRPFILAGHSQGSQHLVRLIQELETLHETSVLLDRLVAAYLIGCAVRALPRAAGPCRPFAEEAVLPSDGEYSLWRLSVCETSENTHLRVYSLSAFLRAKNPRGV